MLQNDLAALFERDLGKLKIELLAYENEMAMWAVTPAISNSAGNLALHLLGNLNHFICAVLGNSGYVRNRDAEFSQKHVPRDFIIAHIDETIVAVSNTLKGLDAAALAADYPQDKWNQNNTVGFLLLHLSTHLNYHLGQINYHRRLLG